MDNYIITIARSFGSGGKEIASLLSEKLGIPWYERQILTMFFVPNQERLCRI